MTVKKYIEENKSLPPALYDEEISEIRAWVKERKELLQPTTSV